MRTWQKVCVIGCGLIGGSLALALRRTGSAVRIVGIDIDPQTRETALARQVVDDMVHLEDGLHGADLIVVATHIPVAKTVITRIAAQEDHLAQNAVVTDVCGTKADIVRLAEGRLRRSHFVGGHPMAGSERSGVEASSAKLLENAIYVLTRTAATEVAAAADLAELLHAAGARVTFMHPEEHDRVVAAISHVPHLIAAALVNQVAERSGQDARYPELAAGGFRDITRIASSDPRLWRDIALENRREILPLLEDWNRRIDRLREAIHRSNDRDLEDFFRAARGFRDALPARSTGAIQAVYSFTVIVPDEPGVIGRVASLLGEHRISIRNIGILESREGDEGQLLLQFDTSEYHDRALDLLRGYGYKLADRL